MSRDSSGTYDLPLPDVVAGDTIEATWANTTLTDLETEMTDSLSRSGKGGMTAPLKLAAGTVSAPGLAFSSETNTGFYRAAAGDMRLALAGSEFLRVTSAGLRIADKDIVIGTAAKGIDFSAQTATAATGATTVAEILNHYETGTWTPNLWDSSLSSSESQAYVGQLGKYTRIGNLVLFSGQIALSSLGTLTGANNAIIGPLPFAAASTFVAGGVMTEYTGISVPQSSVLTVCTVSAQNWMNIRFNFESSPGVFSMSALPISYLASNSTFAFNGFYFVS